MRIHFCTVAPPSHSGKLSLEQRFLQVKKKPRPISQPRLTCLFLIYSRLILQAGARLPFSSSLLAEYLRLCHIGARLSAASAPLLVRGKELARDT